MLVTDSWQRFVHLPVFIPGGSSGPKLQLMLAMVEAPCVPLFTPPGKSQGTCFGARSQEGSAPPTAVDSAEVCVAPALHAREYTSSILGFSLCGRE